MALYKFRIIIIIIIITKDFTTEKVHKGGSRNFTKGDRARGFGDYAECV